MESPLRPLRACAALLPEAFAAEHSRLFVDEHLTELAHRLFRYATEGVPAVRPEPHFPAECSPPLADAFAPFRPILAEWAALTAEPSAVHLRRWADTLAAAGCANLLLLLGQRLTPGSLTDARAIPPTLAELVAAAEQPIHPDESLTVMARALAKHAARATGEFWGTVTGTAAARNDTARRILMRILDRVTWWNVFGHFQHETVYEARVASGHGARWGRGGGTFIGFLEPFEESWCPSLDGGEE